LPTTARSLPRRSTLLLRTSTLAHARALVALVALVALAGCAPTEDTPLRLPESAELRLVEDARGRPVAVEATGLPAGLVERLRQTPPTEAEWAAAFPVTQATADHCSASPLAGVYRIAAGGAVRFLPREPFARGRRYVACWNGADGVTDAELPFAPSREGARASTQVADVFPSADLVPVNLARVHVLFTAPMSPGRSGAHVRLEREGGAEVAGVFAGAGDDAEDPGALRETWNDDRTRVTLELATDAEGRTLLEIAGRYRLAVDAGWEDAEGVPLRDGFEKVFAVTEPDRERPDPRSWTLTPPVSAGAPLTLDFSAPLDHAGLERSLEVLAQDDRVAGTVRISNEERRWVFSPRRPWTAGSYVVRVLAGLDDPAGNPLAADTPAAEGSTATVLPFRVELGTAGGRSRGAAGP
jgi:hypothetical protein